MSRFFTVRFRWTFAIGLIALAGCSGKKGPDRKPVYPVRGKLLVDDHPAAGALVVLHPVGGSADAERPSLRSAPMARSS